MGCARYVGHRVGWGGVGHVDVGLKLHRSGVVPFEKVCAQRVKHS